MATAIAAPAPPDAADGAVDATAAGALGAVLAALLLQAETNRSTAPIAVTARILAPVPVIRMVISSASGRE
jgi:hypothetical protein